MRQPLDDLSERAGAGAPALAAHRRLVAALRDPACYPHSVGAVELIETHISSVLLAGEFAYKLKKPLDLGFLDFSTLEARRRCCEEELRINRRTAPSIYLDVVAVGGTADSPVLIGVPGPAATALAAAPSLARRVADTGATPIDYAVRMRRFDQEALLDRRARRGALDPQLIDALAATLAAFHDSAAIAAPGTPFGSASRVAADALANFSDIERQRGRSDRLNRLHRWTAAHIERLAPAFEARKAHGRVRECHGDLHLGNIALIDAAPVPFDAIEFNDDFRWIDTASEIAFLAMDLLDRADPTLAWRFVNGYLERSGDYDAASVLRFYLVYRAMVRAKIDCIRSAQPGIDRGTRSRVEGEYDEYLALAGRLAHDVRPALIITHGVSGSGKTTVAQGVVGRLGAIRLRSDVERKRLHGMAPDARSAAALHAGPYAASASVRTYERLAELAGAVVAAGWTVVVDAAFLRRADRARFLALARAAGVPALIADCAAPAAVLRERIESRARGGADASEATLEVLEAQLREVEPLDADERAIAVRFDAATAEPPARGAWTRELDGLATRLAVEAGTSPAVAATPASRSPPR